MGPNQGASLPNYMACPGLYVNKVRVLLIMEVVGVDFRA